MTLRGLVYSGCLSDYVQEAFEASVFLSTKACSVSFFFAFANMLALNVCSYGMPTHGKDFWGRKADERAKMERETGKRKRWSLRFSWKKSKKERKLPEEEIPRMPHRHTK